MIAKVALNVDCNSWAKKVIFYSISHKTASNNILLHFYMAEKHWIWILHQETFKTKELY